MGRLEVYGATSTALAALVIGNAWTLRWHFYATCVHLTRSSASLMVLLNFGLYLTIIFGRFLQRVFFGELRALEVEHLYERSWFAVTETCLAMSIFRDEFDVRFIILFASLLVVKIFHWIAGDRVDFMDQGNNPSWTFHLRMTSIMTILLSIDLGMLWYSIDYTLGKGPSMMFIFGFEVRVPSI
ncbi:E3 ubiquitin-protein ligase hrd1 [Blyttiomyces sp. JEL0837]|nr:E3 ubiquitin-protein ligase hrd1 [Blyttiomyces sp. JEL0837]